MPSGAMMDTETTIAISGEDHLETTWTAVYIPIPSEPKKYIDYILQSGVLWEDYIIILPTQPQPRLTSTDSSINTKEIRKYIETNKEKHTINMPKWVSDGYIIFKTKRILDNGEFANLLLAIDYQSKWIIDKNASLDKANSNEYIYRLTSVPLISNIEKIKFKANILDYILEWKLSISSVTTEDQNPVEKITIVFK